MTAPTRIPVADLAARTRALIVGVCFAAIVFDGYDLIVYGSTAPALLVKKEWDLSPADVGHIGSYALMGMFFGAISAGSLTDRLGHRRVFLGCLTLYSSAMIAVALAPDPTFLSWARFVAGLGFGGIAPVTVSLVVEIAPPGRRHALNALMLAGLPVGGIIAAVSAKVLLADHGFRLLWSFGALALVTVVPLAWWVVPDLTRTARPAADEAVGSARDLIRPRALPALALLSSANFAGLLLVFGLNTWLPTLMRNAGYSLGSALTFQVLLNVGAVIGGLSGSALADRLGSRWVATGFFGVAAIAIYAMSETPPTGAMWLAAMAAGAGSIGTQIVLFGYVATHYPDAVRATAVGITSGIGRLGAVCGPTVGGWLISNGASFGEAFAFFAAVAALGALACVAVPTRRRTLPGLAPAGRTLTPEGQHA